MGSSHCCPNRHRSGAGCKDRTKCCRPLPPRWTHRRQCPQIPRGRRSKLTPKMGRRSASLQGRSAHKAQALSRCAHGAGRRVGGRDGQRYLAAAEALFRTANSGNRRSRFCQPSRTSFRLRMPRHGSSRPRFISSRPPRKRRPHQRKDNAYAAIWSLLSSGLEPTDPLAAAIRDSEAQSAKEEPMRAVNAADKSDDRARRMKSRSCLPIGRMRLRFN